MSRELPTNPKTEQELFKKTLSPYYALSFENFVQDFFPWKKPGTPLESFERPRPWQLDVIRSVDENNLFNVDNPNPKIYKCAIAGGRGIGKSAINAWMMLWAMSTRPGISVICVANSETQLKTTLWADTSRWLSMMPNSHWFEMQSLSMHPSQWYAASLLKTTGIDSKQYSIMCRTYSEERPGTFVGMHNPIGTLLVVDEGADLPYSIDLACHGFFTEINANRFWIMTSNPRRLSGKFYDIFNKPLDDWKRFQIDTRTVEGIDPSFHEGLISSYGLDSDIVKVDVLGQFPNQEENSFIPHEYIEEAVKRKAYPDLYAPLIMGCDVAGEGKDKTVVILRRGNIIESIYHWSETNIEITNEKIAKLCRNHSPDAIVVDAQGPGAVVESYLKGKGYIVDGILGQRKSSKPHLYRNIRTEIYDYTKQAIMTTLQLPNDCPELINEAKSIISFIEPNTGLLAIEPKQRNKSKYGVVSPDFFDALAYTYAVTPARKDIGINFSRRSQVDIGPVLSVFKAREDNWA
ncbi:MAG: terminase [Candidatus Liberibacter europaeus]|nr:terminase [Candidatus Liberibacter europaeus]